MDPDDQGLPRVETVQPNQQFQARRTQYVRDGYGHPIEIIVTAELGAPHPAGTGGVAFEQQSRSTRIFYDLFGYKTREINPLGHEQQFAYDPALGVEVAHLDVNRNLTTRVLDGFGRSLRTIPATGADTLMTYSLTPDSPYVVTSTTVGKNGALLSSQATFHDRLGREIREESAAPRGRTQYVWTHYDPAGRVDRVSAPQFSNNIAAAQFAVTTWDSFGRLTSRTEPDGVVSVRASYSGLTSTVTNGRDKRHVVIRDALDVPLRSQSQDEAGNLRGQVIFEHGPFGVLDATTKELNGTQSTTRMTYDDLGRRTDVFDPDRGHTRAVYNGFGEVIYERDPSGAVQWTIYDRLSRPIFLNNPDGQGAIVYDTSPGGIGAVASAQSPDLVTTRRSYDSFGRLARETTGIVAPRAPTAREELTIDWTYDGAGRLESIRYPTLLGGQRYETFYDYSAHAGGVLWAVRDGVGKTLWQAEDVSAFGDLAQEVFGNGLRVRRAIDSRSGLLRGITAAFLPGPFHAEGDPEPVPGIPSGSGLVQDLVYDYDGARNVTLREDRGRSPEPMGNGVDVREFYGYDDLNRLATWTVQASGQPTRTYTYQFDDHGNLTGRTTAGGEGDWTFDYTSSRPHAVTRSTVGSTVKTYDYDWRGRRYADGDRRITYNWFDLPRTTTRNNSTEATFEYDAFHARIRKTAQNAETVTLGNLYERRTPGPSEPATHVFRVPGPGRPIAEVEWSAGGSLLAERYLQTDRLGSVEVVTGSGTTAASRLLARQRFEPYGNTVDPANPLAAPPDQTRGGTRRGFTGHEHDDELGFVNMNGRVYDPSSASFLTPDPLVSRPAWAHAFHPYAYVVNNPTNAVDPTGFEPVGGEGDAEVSIVPVTTTTTVETEDGSQYELRVEGFLVRIERRQWSGIHALRCSREESGEDRPGSAADREGTILEEPTRPSLHRDVVRGQRPDVRNGGGDPSGTQPIVNPLVAESSLVGSCGVSMDRL